MSLTTKKLKDLHHSKTKHREKTLKLLLLFQQNNVLKTVVYIHNNVIELLEERFYLSEEMCVRLSEAYSIFRSKFTEKWQESLFSSEGICKNRLNWFYEGLVCRIDYFLHILEELNKKEKDNLVKFVWYSDGEPWWEIWWVFPWWYRSYNIYHDVINSRYDIFPVTFIFFGYINTIQLEEKLNEKHNINTTYKILVVANDLNEGEMDYSALKNETWKGIKHVKIKQKEIKTYIKYFNNETKKQKEIMKKYKKNEMITPEEYGIMGYNEELDKKYREHCIKERKERKERKLREEREERERINKKNREKT